MAGLPKSIIEKYGITKKAWQVYRAGRRKHKTSNRKTNKSTRRTYVQRRTYMTKRKTSRRRGMFNASSIMKFAKIGALVGPAAYAALQPIPPKEKLVAGVKYYTGFNLNDGQWRWNDMAVGWLPYIATSLIGVGVQKLNGIIRRL